MSYSILIEELAENDIDEAFLWYELQKEGLGFEFIDIINESLEKIRISPFSYQKIYKILHRFVLRRFPYNIFYYIDDDVVYITAVFHTKRNPSVWMNRL